VVAQWSLTPPVSKSNRGRGVNGGVELVRGKRIRPGGASLRLLTLTGGWLTVASGAAVPAKPMAARATEVGEDPWVGRSGLRWPAGPVQGFRAGRGNEGVVD
jgi:hypothetical protein